MSKERRKSARHSATKRALASVFSSPSASHSFLTAVSLPPSLSPVHEDATDRALTFLQSARDRNVPVRFGKWSAAEDAYLLKLVQLFKDGLLAHVDGKTSLRSWLAQMLNCCPMRISKKQMHGHKFAGKNKYKRNVSRSDRLTQQQYEQHCDDVWRLRAEFLHAWADDEADRRDSAIRRGDKSFQQWYDKVLEIVPTPTVAKPTVLNQCREKRRVDLLTELVEVEAKRQKTFEAIVAEPEQETRKLVDDKAEETAIIVLEPAPVPEPIVGSYDEKVTPLPLSFCSDNATAGDWLSSSSRGQWNEQQTLNHVNVNEARYIFCEDQVQVSFHDDNQQTAGLSMMRRSSRVVIDFGTPSCWHSGEEPKCSPFVDYSQWTDNDLTEDLAILLEPETFDTFPTSLRN